MQYGVIAVWDAAWLAAALTRPHSIACVFHTTYCAVRRTAPSMPYHTVLCCAVLCCVGVQVLYEYQRRDSLMQQLLTERDEVRRASRRSNTESSKLERERDEAARTAARLKV
jgi:hypothetical protein